MTVTSYGDATAATPQWAPQGLREPNERYVIHTDAPHIFPFVLPDCFSVSWLAQVTFEGTKRNTACDRSGNRSGEGAESTVLHMSLVRLAHQFPDMWACESIKSGLETTESPLGW
ncbi:hypothetical protein ACU8KH_01834 [Lachancea thermotolerans]